MELLTTAEANRIRTYCAEEVRRQGRGRDRVSGMFEAWIDALDRQYKGEPLNAGMVTGWAALIEPAYNEPSMWRRVDVRVGLATPPSAANVPRLMIRYFENLED